VIVVAEGSKSAHRLRLDTGHIEARVDDRPSLKPKLVVETPDVDVVVTGTVFGVDVARNPRGATVTKVSVDKGRVVIMRGGTEIALVTSGSTWSSEVAEEPSPSVVAPVAPRGSRPLLPHSSPEPVAKLPSAANLADVPVGTLGEENAAFQAAIDSRNRGDDAAVVDRLGQLMVRYPGSPLAGEARVERMRALARLGRTEAAAREARRYLAAYPEGFARDEAKRLVLRSAATPSNPPAP
jgi:ferric-dicitrate binding protein FerR (iron transport regulator)